MLETLANKMHLAEGVLDGSDESLAQRAQHTLGHSLLHCQEAILPGDATPVLLTAVESLHRETVSLRPRTRETAATIFGYSLNSRWLATVGLGIWLMSGDDV